MTPLDLLGVIIGIVVPLAITYPAYRWLWTLLRAAHEKRDTRLIGFFAGTIAFFAIYVVLRFSLHGFAITSNAPYFVLFGIIAAAGPGGSIGFLTAKTLHQIKKSQLQISGCSQHAAEVALVYQAPPTTELTDREHKALKRLFTCGWILTPIFYLIAINN